MLGASAVFHKGTACCALRPLLRSLVQAACACAACNRLTCCALSVVSLFGVGKAMLCSVCSLSGPPAPCCGQAAGRSTACERMLNLRWGAAQEARPGRAGGRGLRPQGARREGAREGGPQLAAQRRSARAEARADAAPVKEEIFEVGEAGMAIGDLAARLAVTPGEVVKTLFRKGLMVAVNQVPAPRLAPRAQRKRGAPRRLRRPASFLPRLLAAGGRRCLCAWASGEERSGRRGAALCYR